MGVLRQRVAFLYGYGTQAHWITDMFGFRPHGDDRIGCGFEMVTYIGDI
jgi:hypothetical protein